MEGTLPMDDNLKQLLRELGHALNDTVSESERVKQAIHNIRAAGFHIVLKLEATIGLAPRQSEEAGVPDQDQRFLHSFHIRVDPVR
jgi:hypothetical protein